MQANRFTFTLREDDPYGETVETKVGCHLYEGAISNVIGGLAKEFKNEIG